MLKNVTNHDFMNSRFRNISSIFSSVKNLYHHPHPRVQRKMEALWLKSQGEFHQWIAQLTGVTVNAVLPST